VRRPALRRLGTDPVGHRRRTHEVSHKDRNHLCGGGAHPPIIRLSGDWRNDVTVLLGIPTAPLGTPRGQRRPSATRLLAERCECHPAAASRSRSGLPGLASGKVSAFASPDTTDSARIGHRVCPRTEVSLPNRRRDAPSESLKRRAPHGCSSVRDGARRLGLKATQPSPVSQQASVSDGVVNARPPHVYRSRPRQILDQLSFVEH
jgi:hypothetical protein